MQNDIWREASEYCAHPHHNEQYKNTIREGVKKPNSCGHVLNFLTPPPARHKTFWRTQKKFTCFFSNCLICTYI